MKKEDESMTMEYSLFHHLEQETFQSICKSCELKWQTQKCPEDNPVENICVQEECQKHAYSCGLKTCKVCQENHKLCRTVQLGAFSEYLNGMTDYQTKFFKRLYFTDEELMDLIKKNREELAKKISQGSINSQAANVLQIVCGARKAQTFNGKDANKLFTLLRQKAKQTNQYEDELHQLYTKHSQELIQKNINMEKLIFDHFLKGTKPNAPSPSTQEKFFLQSPLLTQCLNELYATTPQFYKNKTFEKYGHMQSFNKEKKAFEKPYLDFLKQSLYNPKSAQLLFRASEHNFETAKFHAKCDEKSKTLTIVRTDYMKTIFAYAEMAWNSTSNNYINDTTGRSCIIWLHPKVKNALTKAQYSIYCQTDYGPTFGAHDLYIGNGGNGTSNFCHSYNNGYSKSQVTYTLMTGNPSAETFKAVEYQVYQLTF